MVRKKMKIIFMGTPYFAVPSLQQILASSHEVVAVVTAPDKPAGRGMNMQTSAVKDFAVQNNIPVLQPIKLKDPIFLEQIKSYNADLFVVVAFRMLPEVVWNMPPLGSINLHGSLLPKYRGAAPINWAVINGENETGVTTFFLQHEIDTGKIILQKSFSIDNKETAGDVHDKMMHIGAQLLIETIELIANNEAVAQEQIYTSNCPHAPKISKETGKIDWNNEVAVINNLIRGLQPSPAAYTYLEGKILKIHQAKIELQNHTYAPGKLITDNKTFIHIYTTNGYLLIEILQLEGKKRMQVEEFLRGNMLKDSIILPS